MAQADVEKLAKRLLDELYATSNEFRRALINPRPHFFSADEKEIREQVITQLQTKVFIDEEIPKSIIKIIDREVPKIVPSLKNSLKSTDTIKMEYSNVTNTSFDLAITQAKAGGQADLYSPIGKAKAEAQRTLVHELDRKIQQFNKRRTKSPQRAGTLTKRDPTKEPKADFQAKGLLLDIGHTGGTAVSEERIDKFNDILYEFSQTSNAAAQEFIGKLLSDFGLVISKVPGKGIVIQEVHVELEASSVNRSRADIDKETADAIQGALKKLQEKIDWPTDEGSDSPVDVATKKVINLLADGKNIKKEKINLKKSSGKSKTKKRKISRPKRNFKDKTKVVLGAKAAAGARGSRAKSEGTNIPIQQLIGILNQKLPNTVLRNMGPPRLTNQTGRFARSTRVTEITKTGQGFPSIGYTYERNPYQTFEVGNRQGSQDYDPRKLIDTSIRELAAQFAIGRFYTRRV